MRTSQKGCSRTFIFLEWFNALALGVSLAALAVAVYLGRASGADMAWSAGLLAFASLWHVNYYARQLMHDNANDLAYLWKHRRLRRAPLAEDLRRAAGTPR